MTTITAAAPPRPNAPVALTRGFLTGAVIGASPAAFVVGIVIERVPLIITALALPTVYFLLLFLAGAPRRAREAAIAPHTALAMIESLQAKETEDSDVSVQFDLTVAPDDAPAYRVEITQAINVAYLPDYQPGGVIAVRYPPDRPWLVSIVKRPTPQWEERLIGARLDSVPGPAMASEPAQGCGPGLLGFVGLLLGAAAIVLLFRADLFGTDAATAQQPTTTTTTTTTTSSTTVTSISGTVSLGQGQSMLDEGELTQAIDSLTAGADKREAITVVVQDRLLTVMFSPAGTQTVRFDPRSLPYDRFPDLVKEAEATAGIGAPQSWQINAVRLTGSVTITVTVTGSEGTASLVADEQGDVVRRTGPSR